MRAEYSEGVNRAIKANPSADEKTKQFWLSQVNHGTCIPMK